MHYLVAHWSCSHLPLCLGSLYWTGGMYNPQISGWVWSAHNLPLPPFAPWDEGHPVSNPSPLHRVSIAHWSRHQAFWRTAAYTEMYPYICEVSQLHNAFLPDDTNLIFIGTTCYATSGLLQ